MAKNKTLELSIRIAGRVDKSLTAAINQTNTMMGSLTTTMSRVGKAGLAAMGTLTAVTVAGLVKCTNKAQEFEASMGDVVKYVDGLADATGKISDKMADNGKTFAENYGVMKDAILDLSTQIPYTADELTQLTAAAGQSGKAMEDLIQRDAGGNISGFLKDVAMVGTAMDISAGQAGDWAAKWEKAFNMDHDQIMVLFDQINYLGANSATTAAEIAQAVNSAASLGQVAGVDTKTTAALADAMLATGVASDRVGTSIKRTFTNLSKGSSATKAMREQWAELGFTAEGVAKSMQTDSVGTLLKVFTAIKDLPSERRVAALSTLFGQWAIEGNAKVVNNLSAFTDALNMVNDPGLYTGSMEREFIIKATKGESIDKMMESAKYALKVDIGDSFLPVKKQFSLMMIDTINGIRKNMPELEAVGESIATVLARGVETLGNALQKALPYIQKGLDYVANNGPEVAETLGKIAAVFIGMKFAPGVENLLKGAGGVLLGTAGTEGGKRTGGLVGGIAGLFRKGQGAAAGASRWSAVVKGGQLGAMEYGGSRWNRMNGRAVGVMATLQNMSGLFSGKKKSAADASRSVFNTIFNAKQNGLTATGILKNAITNSAAGQYVSSVFDGLKDVRTARARFSGSLGAGAKTLIGSMRSRKGNGLMGTTGLMSFNDAVFGSPLSAGGAIKNILGSGGGLIKSGGSLLGNIWGPIAGGFGSLFAGAVPVVGAISGIIAVVSILGDHLEDIRGIIGNVFGEKGLAVFDTFTGKLSEVGKFISGLFEDGGVAKALSGLRDTLFGEGGIFAGNSAGMAAFDGAVSVIQSIMGVVGQLVGFATGTVKPIIEEIFGYVTGTVLPGIMNLFTKAAPYISGIISGIGSAVMTGMQIIGSAIQAALPIVEAIISAIMGVASAVIPAVLAGMDAFSQGIAGVMEAVKTIFEGIINFITGVFTGDWSKAWEGVKQIFGGVFDGLAELFKAPINAVIALINKAIEGINGLGLDIPWWVPILGGKKFAINIPPMNLLANGGFTNGPSIAGEAGREAVISFKSGVRAKNIDTWMQAGRMLGIPMLDMGKTMELRDIDTENRDDDREGGNFTFAPQIIIQGSADREVIDEALREAQERFEAWYEQMMRRKARTAY